MIAELRRRAYLNAMQVASWLPRVQLPFAAPSRVELLQSPEPASAEIFVAVQVPVQQPTVRPAIELSRSTAPVRVFVKPQAKVEAEAVAVSALPPRFVLQLLRAGDCALLIELATGGPLQSRDPSYLLLKDLLCAAGLPNTPQQVGDGSPIRWPLLSRGSLDQGPDAARDYVQGVLAGQLEAEPCRCLWLIGLPAVRFAGEADDEAYYRELQVEGLGPAWALPSLELLMDEPERKADVWRAMGRILVHWTRVV